MSLTRANLQKSSSMTNKLRILGWKAGLHKVSMTKLLHEETSLSLSGAKQVVDQVLEGQEIDVDVPANSNLRDLVHRLRLLGARVTVVALSNEALDNTLLDQGYIDWFEQQLCLALQQPIRHDQCLNAVQQFLDHFAETLPRIPQAEYGHILALLDRWQHDGYINGINFNRNESARAWLSDIIGTKNGQFEEPA